MVMMDMLLKFYMYPNLYSINITVEMQFTSTFGTYYVEDSYSVFLGSVVASEDEFGLCERVV